ncbi:hypothetical protein Tco_0870610 [Tanacetum coccineum]
MVQKETLLDVVGTSGCRYRVLQSISVERIDQGNECVETLCKTTLSASDGGTKASGISVAGSRGVIGGVVIGVVGSGVVSGVGVVVVVGGGGMTKTSTSSNGAEKTGGISCWI